jgi:hypothetical protein
MNRARDKWKKGDYVTWTGTGGGQMFGTVHHVGAGAGNMVHVETPNAIWSVYYLNLEFANVLDKLARAVS